MRSLAARFRATPSTTTLEVLEREFQLIHGTGFWDPPDRTPHGDREKLLREAREAAKDEHAENAPIDEAVPPERIAEAERLAIHAWSVRSLSGAGQAALCLSGGGIRSAAFGLGILQGLARRGLLSQFHYLSTVSGGGYIGGWLTAWRCRAGIDKVLIGLRGRNFGEMAEPEPFQRMRFNQNFLTPKIGFGSADTWTALATVLRNLILNWAVFLPLFLSILLLPRLIAALLVFMQQGDADSSLYVLFYPILPHDAKDRPLTPLSDLLTWETWRAWVDSLAVISIVIGFAFSAYNRPAGGRSSLTEWKFVWRVLFPVFLGVMLLTAAVASLQHRLSGSVAELARWACLGAIVYTVARALAALVASRRHYRKPEAEKHSYDRSALEWEFLGWAAAGICTGLLIGVGARLLCRALALYGPLSGDPQQWLAAVLTVAGPPWIVSSFLVGEVVYIGATSRLPYSEQDGEWLARVAGWFGAVATLYLAFAWLVLFGWGMILAESIVVKSAVASAGLLSVLGALTPLTRPTAASAAKETLPFTRIVTLLSAVFILGAIAAFAELANQCLLSSHGGLAQLIGLEQVGGRLPAGLEAAFVFALAVALFAGSLLLSMMVNVNKFSLHDLYRNRLIKTFLGASNFGPGEGRNPFDGFSDNDNIAMAKLLERVGPERHPPEGAPQHGILYPVLNMSLNLLNSQNLAWQERKAEPFICTPMFTGADRVGYRRSGECAVGRWFDEDDQEARSISLGTAMAISGAAVSPNWGYHSSPVTSFLMMLANVRLGWWLGNPRNRSTWRLRGPRASWNLFVQEALGRTDDRQPWVYLSDGGHFENLGIYEMVRRRCRTIVVSDAGSDPNCTLEDLGNAVRKISIDLGVRIEFERIHVRKRGDARVAGVYCAMGKIVYPGPEGADGWILYFKPGFYGIREPADVRAYAAANAKFPHESTLNQWFGESQFESYRSLGAYVIEEICRNRVGDMMLTDFIETAQRYLRAFEREYVTDGATIVDIRKPIQLVPTKGDGGHPGQVQRGRGA